MPRAEIRYDEFKVKAFLDTNIVLECLPLSELPWDEVDPEGPIIVLVTPTAMREIDSKKHDGRVGRRAREFNRLISVVAAGGPPKVIRESGPRVELALARAQRIPWNQYDDLDPEDGDSCIVAEVLHAKDMDGAGKLIISHDIKPIAMASAYDLETLHVPDAWLRPSEPSPADRENQKLKQQLSAFHASQPEFEVSIELPEGEPVRIVSLEDLSSEEREEIHRTIRDLNPPARQSRDPFGLTSLGSTDYSYDERFDAYRHRVAEFMPDYSRHLERLFNQTRLTVKVSNVGRVQADNLLMEVSISSGWLHNKFAFVSAQGPTPPSLRTGLFMPTPYLNNIVPPRVGRHQFEFKERPDCGRGFSVTCEDFRRSWDFVGVAGFDPRADDTPTITVSLTASNFRGTARFEHPIVTIRERYHVSQVVDLTSLRPIIPIPMRKWVEDRDFDFLDLRAFDGGADD